jgi:hypothetical protein
MSDRTQAGNDLMPAYSNTVRNSQAQLLSVSNTTMPWTELKPYCRSVLRPVTVADLRRTSDIFLPDGTTTASMNGGHSFQLFEDDIRVL